jgi:nucleoid-associated protein YgaU
MINRYSNRNIFQNGLEQYENTLRQRNVRLINQYETPVFNFPTAQEIKNLKTVEHIWSPGDKFFKLSYQYYGDARDWWVIAKFNNKPTESHVSLGDIILIPLPLNQVLNYLRG